MGCGGLAAETPTPEKTLLVSCTTCNPWLTPTCQACPTKGHTAHTTSLAATQLTSSLLSRPWQESTTEKGPSLQQLMDELIATTHRVCRGPGEQPSPILPNPCSPDAQHYTKYPTSWGWGALRFHSLLSFNALHRACVLPVMNFFANRSISHHKQMHRPTLIVSHLSSLLASSSPGEQIFTKHSRNFPF